MVRRMVLSAGLSLALWGALPPQQAPSSGPKDATRVGSLEAQQTIDQGTPGGAAVDSEALQDPAGDRSDPPLPLPDREKAPRRTEQEPPRPSPVEDPPLEPEPPTPKRAPESPSAPAEDDPFGPATPTQAPQQPAPLDRRVLPSQSPALEPDGSGQDSRSGAFPSDAVPPAGIEPSVIPASNLAVGPNAMGITVEVIADPDSNINVDLPVRILVKNTGRSTAAGVIVCYPVPTGIDFVASQPAPSQTLGPLQVWQLEPLAPGAEKSLRLTVRARQVGPIDHAPTVTIRGGTKTRTMVRQPRLKVEMAASETRVQRGQSIKFDITVTNTGDGPARDVVLEASLSNGLTHASKGSVLKQALRDAFESGSLQPGDSRLIELPVDAAQGGEQTCTVVATSPDVAIGQDPGANEARAVAKLMVVEPMLRLQLTGSRERYPDTIARYVISVDNPGTAPARQVQVAAQVPTGGTPYEIPADARFDEERRTLYWNIGEIEPGKPVELTFHVRMGGIGNYPVSAYTRAAGGLKDEKSCTTQVVGLAQVEFDLLARRRVLDTGEETLYEIRLENTGSIDASNVLVKAQLTEQLVVVETGGTNAPATAGSPNAPRDALFPPIERIPPGGKLTLTVRVKAVAEGVGACKVSVAHDNVPPLEHTESIRITRPVE